MSLYLDDSTQTDLYDLIEKGDKKTAQLIINSNLNQSYKEQLENLIVNNVIDQAENDIENIDVMEAVSDIIDNKSEYMIDQIKAIDTFRKDIDWDELKEQGSYDLTDIARNGMLNGTNDLQNELTKIADFARNEDYDREETLEALNDLKVNNERTIEPQELQEIINKQKGLSR